MMTLNPLTAVSPIDGRYAGKTAPLREYFSEFALIRNRVRVEIEYFISLTRFGLSQLEGMENAEDLRKTYTCFTIEDAGRIKEIEKTTNHDVKAVEYFIKEKFREAGLEKYSEFVHFGLTSQDINNTATPLSVKEALHDIIYPKMDEIIRELQERADEWKDIPMLARTHGQPASPTRLGKEIEVFVARLKEKAGSGGESFTAYASMWMARAGIKGVRNYGSAVSALRRFMKKEDILFADMTVAMMRGFEASLSDRPRARSLYTSCILRMFNDARDELNNEDCGVLRVRNTLAKYSAPRQAAAEKRALTLDELLRLMRLPRLGTLTRDGLPCRRDMARDCFLLSFFLMGMNSADMYAATVYDGKSITYQRAKTKDRRADHAAIRVDIHPCLNKLFKRYRGKDGRVFCFAARYATAADFNRAVNLGLKEAGEAAGIHGLQFYAARHTMATIAVNETGISKYVVNDMLNHVEPSLRVTDLYIKRDFGPINEANFNLIAYVMDKAGVDTVE